MLWFLRLQRTFRKLVKSFVKRSFRLIFRSRSANASNKYADLTEAVFPSVMLSLTRSDVMTNRNFNATIAMSRETCWSFACETCLTAGIALIVSYTVADIA